jgi:hypothetical protein
MLYSDLDQDINHDIQFFLACESFLASPLQFFPFKFETPHRGPTVRYGTVPLHVYAVFWIRIGFNADPYPAFYLSGGPDPDSRSQTMEGQETRFTVFVFLVNFRAT